MTETLCGFVGDRESALIGYLYDDPGPPGHAAAGAERVAFEAHLAVCALCALELEQLRGVRRGMLAWSPPELARVQAGTRGPGWDRRWRVLAEIPAWAQVAAALLVLGVSAGIANLDVRYDERGLSIRTGWSRPSNPIGPIGPIGPTPAVVNSGDQAAPWRAEMTALEQRIRADVQTLRASSAGPSGQTAQVAKSLTGDPELMRKVTALVKESERRQESELALRVASIARELNDQRRSDLMKIDNSQRALQDKLGIEVLRQRTALNRLISVSQIQ
jgi:hypothetical protein